MNEKELQEKKKFNILIIFIPILLVVVAVIGIIIYPKISMKLRDGKWTLEDGFYVYYKNGEKLIDQKIATGGKYYIVDELGHRVENFVEYDKDGKTVIAYYGSDGAKVIDDFVEIKGVERYFDHEGKLGKNQWAKDRYIDKNGKITKNKWVDEFYLDENGYKAKNTWVKNKYVGDDGKILKSTTTPDGFEVDKYGNKIVPLLEQISSNEYAFGTEILFGNFEQDNDTTNNAEPIEWILVTHTKDKAYLLSKKVLYNTKYQEENEAVFGRVNYKDSFIKHWLDNIFYNKAFTEEEKGYIVETENGNAFIPSVKEVENYLPNSLYRLAAPTKLAKDSTKQSKNIDNASIYWLRDGGSSMLHKAIVSDMGEIINDDITKEVVVESYYKKGESKKSSTEDKVGKMLIGKGAKYLVGQIPFVGDIINELGITEDIVGGALDSGSSEEDLELVEEKEKNEYLNVGLVTNEFNGVRPMVVIDLEHKQNGSKKVESTNSNSNQSLNEKISNANLLKGYKFDTCIEDVDTIKFGKYEQDGNIDNGKEDIDWVVLAREDDKALLMSKYILSLNKYNEDKEDITYEDSTIRSFLNNDFYDEAFSANETNIILETKVLNKNNNNIYQKSSNGDKKMDTVGGEDTEDYVFILSFEEAKKYFGNMSAVYMNAGKLTESEKKYYKNDTNLCNTTITKAVNESNIHNTGKSYKNYPPMKITSTKYQQTDWWLRDVGRYQNYACYVSEGINDKGATVTSFKGVRPCIWVKIK